MTDKEEKADELEATGGEAEGLRNEREAFARELESRNAAITKLEQELASKNGEVAALERALEVQQKLNEGGDFGLLASQYSDDKQNASSNGYIGVVNRKISFSPAFVKAAFALKSSGDLSGPILSDFGYHIIRLEDSRVGYEANREEILTRLNQEQHAKGFADFLVSLKEVQQLQVYDRNHLLHLLFFPPLR